MKITGQIKSTEGEIIPFASVYVSDISGKPTGIGTTSDGDGNFSLDNVDSSDYITFSSIGYKKSTRPMSGYVTQNNSMLVLLDPDELGTVVITGTKPVVNLPYFTPPDPLTVKKIPIWPWIVGGSVILLALGYGGYRLAIR